jgi:hypothetical protein
VDAGVQAALRVRNNHDLAFRGPVRFATGLPDGRYGAAEVRGGVARAVVELAATGEVRLARDGALRERPFAAGPLRVTPRAGGLDLRWLDRQLGALELELAVRPGTSATPEDVAPRLRALDIAWAEQPGGTLRGDVRQDGYALQVTLTPYGGGWVDMTARRTRVAAPAGPAYVALVRRVSTPGASEARLRFDGRVVDGLVSPDTWDRDFWYVRGVDWTSWKAGGVSLAAVNGFTPAPTIKRAHEDSACVEGSHSYVWERTRHDGDHVYLISEVAGPNPGQETSRYMPATPYAPMRQGDVVELQWRLAIEAAPASGWEESQLRTFAGYRAAEQAGDVAGDGPHEAHPLIDSRIAWATTPPSAGCSPASTAASCSTRCRASPAIWPTATSCARTTRASSLRGQVVAGIPSRPSGTTAMAGVPTGRTSSPPAARCGCPRARGAPARDACGCACRPAAPAC